MNRCVIFGGAGFLGSTLARRLAASGKFEEVVIADLLPFPGKLPPGMRFVPCDVRSPIARHVVAQRARWIFNLVSVPRAPGEESNDDRETTLFGAQNISEFAAQIGCPNVFFRSSPEVYGTSEGAIDENHRLNPVSAHGLVNLAAELTHEIWQKSGAERRLVVLRPAWIYGPGGRGPAAQVVRAIRRGLFVFPGPRTHRKSYAYVEGVVESIEFLMDRKEPLLICNYAETPTETVETLVKAVRRTSGLQMLQISLPNAVAAPLVGLLRVAMLGRCRLRAGHVRSLAQSSWILPTRLQELGFRFRYEFARSLDHWRRNAPEEFR